MTYPEPRVDEVLKGFVCIRVDVDREAEVAKKHGTKGLPDLRLLDPEGRELAKLLGFQSPERLARECRRVLDRLAGKEAGEAAASAKRRDVAVTEDAIRAAVERGCAFLQEHATERAPERGGIAGVDDAALWALASAGKAAADAAVGRLLSRVLEAKLVSTYQVGFQALALARLDARAHAKRLEECARRLAGTQLESGLWTYGDDKTARGDQSNSAYALLGLSACATAGIRVPPEVVARAASAWRKAQNPDGGWGYRSDRETESYASMTESAIAALLLCKSLGARDAADDAALARARAWLEGHFAVEENRGSGYQQGRLLYHLYALERAGTLLAAARIGTHDWFAEGAAFLLGTQRDDGSWDDGADMPVANTAFALLFLTRATRAR